MNRSSRIPLCTLGLVVGALAVELRPDLADPLVLERATVLDGQLWRLLTGHLVHTVPGLAWLDLSLLALLGAWVERRSRQLFLFTMGGSAMLASAAVLLLTDFDLYLGSSALSCGLLTAVALLAFRDGHRALAAATGLLMAAKFLFELNGLWPAGLGALPADAVPVPEAHLAGALGGWIALSLTPRTRRAVGQSAAEGHVSATGGGEQPFAGRARLLPASSKSRSPTCPPSSARP